MIRSAKKEFGAFVIGLLNSNPEDWRFDEHNAWIFLRGETIKLWTANRPYADISLGHVKIGTWWQRRRIRKLLDQVRFDKIMKAMTSACP